MSRGDETRSVRFQFSLGMLMLCTALWAGFLSSVLMVGLWPAILLTGYLIVGWSISKS